MNAKVQLGVFVFLLMSLGVAGIVYKHQFLGFPILAGENETVWKVEAQVNFEIDQSLVELFINRVDAKADHQVAFAQLISNGFERQIVERDKVSMLKLSQVDPGLTGIQDIYLRYDLWFLDNTLGPNSNNKNLEAVQLQQPVWEPNKRSAAELYFKGKDSENIVNTLLQDINQKHEKLAILLINKNTRVEKIQLAAELLSLTDIPAQLVRGVLLEDRKRSASVTSLLQVQIDDQIKLIDTQSLKEIPSQTFLLMQKGSEPLFEVYGAKDLKLRFSTLKQQRSALQTAVETSQRNANPLVDFSIYSLPIKDQSTFKLLLLIPLGALVVVVLRNLVGIRTSGTFMPILIALVFLQTNLLVGLALFLIVVSVGLVMRSWLSSLNLLLVPRIASVLVFVIIIFAAIGIASHKLGVEWGTQVTFFPMIILSWTIERMSILWEEEGPEEVLIQGGGSLLTASLAYLLMSNTFVADFVFLFPEVLLVLLAIIILIGSYSGYRLADLRRFEPMQRF